VIAITIAIMVPELHVPHGGDLSALLAIPPGMERSHHVRGGDAKDLGIGANEGNDGFTWLDPLDPFRRDDETHESPVSGSGDATRAVRPMPRGPKVGAVRPT
jgi:hypothetical protein